MNIYNQYNRFVRFVGDIIITDPCYIIREDSNMMILLQKLKVSATP